MHKLLLAVVLVLSSLLVSPLGAGASCNVIPGVTRDFRGALGVLNRPFASPGDEVGVIVQSGLCDAASAGLGEDADDLAVTLLFQPPGGDTHAVVTTEDCGELEEQLAACGTALGGADRVTCVGRPLRFAMDEFERTQLFFPVPGPADYPFALAPAAGFAGPARILVTQVGESLACVLPGASALCREVRDEPSPGLVACVDELYTLDGTCRAEDGFVSPEFPHFTALPAPNVYAEACDDAVSPGRGCTSGENGDIQFTIDAAGNALIPWNYEDVLVRFPPGPNGLPIARLGRVSVAVDSGVGDGSTPMLESEAALASLSPEGFPVPPLFTPLAATNEAGDGLDTVLFGTIDAPRIVTRVARRVCINGEGAASTICDGDEDCPGGQSCSAPLFDFSEQLAQGVGPIAIAPPDYRVEAELTVPLDGIRESDEIFSFVVNEAIEERSLNSDTDETDFVVTLRDRATGTPTRIVGNEGRAVARVPLPAPFSDAPDEEPRLFTQPAVAAGGEFLAYLESEPREGGLPPSGLNGDGDLIDSVLRIFKLEDPNTDLAGNIGVAAAPLPLIDEQPLRISDDLLFFVTAEFLDSGTQQTVVSVGEMGEAPDSMRTGEGTSTNSFDASISGDGSTVVYSSNAENLDSADANGVQDVFVYDVDTETNTLVSVDSDENPPDPTTIFTSWPPLDPATPQFGWHFSSDPSVSQDGNRVAFVSTADSFQALPDGNAGEDVFVRDRVAGTTERVSLTDAATAPTPMMCDILNYPLTATGVGSGTLRAEFPLGVVDAQISSNGRYVVFSSFQTDLVAGDGNDGCGPANTSPQSWPSVGAAAGAALSAYRAQVRPLFLGSRGLDVFVRDLQDGTTTRESVTSDPGLPFEGELNSGIGFRGLDGTRARAPLIDDAGRYVVFESLSELSLADEEPPAGGCGGPCIDVFLRDRQTQETLLVSDSEHGEKDGHSYADGITPDGRFVAFTSFASGLVEDDTNGASDVFVYEIATGKITRESVSVNGDEERASPRPDPVGRRCGPGIRKHRLQHGAGRSRGVAGVLRPQPFRRLRREARCESRLRAADGFVGVADRLPRVGCVDSASRTGCL